jgi:transposase
MAYTTNEKIGQVRVKAIRLLRSGKSTREVARYLGYAQGTIVKWNKRKNELRQNTRSLPTRSSRPHTSPRRTPREIEGMIVGVRQETKRCSEVVYEVLKARGVPVCLSTVKRILKRYGCLKERSRWKKRRMYPIRPDIEKSGDLVEFDTVHFIDKCGKRTYVYTALDVYSRYGYAKWYRKASTHSSIAFLKQTRRYFPFPIRLHPDGQWTGVRKVVHRSLWCEAQAQSS